MRITRRITKKQIELLIRKKVIRNSQYGYIDRNGNPMTITNTVCSGKVKNRYTFDWLVEKAESLEKQDS